MRRKSGSKGMVAIASLVIAACGLSCGGAKPIEATGADVYGGPSTPPFVEAKPDIEIEFNAVDEEGANLLQAVTLIGRIEKLSSDKGGMDIVADPNQRPIRIWTVNTQNGTSVIHIVGHADGECCPKISELLADVVDRPEFSDGWSSFGYAHIVADNAQEEETLAKLVKNLQSRAASSACMGQVAIQSSNDADPIQTGNDALLKMARKAYARAVELGRPLLVWHDFRDVPRIVPAMGFADNGTMQPFEFKIPNNVLAIPSNVKADLSMDGVSQGIAAIQANINHLQHAVASSFYSIAKGWKANYRGPDMLSAIDAANGRIDSMISQWQAAPNGFGGKSAGLSELRKMKRQNAQAYAEVNRLPLQPTSNSVTMITYADVGVATTDKAAREKEIAELQSSLARLRAMKSRPKRSPEPILTDAFLRGWPASFTSAKAETDFDHWAQKSQRKVWSFIQDNLTQRGFRLGSPEEEPLPEIRMSNVVFQVHTDGDSMRVTPYFVLAGSVALVADPEAKIVRYESITADQNLVGKD